MNWRQAMEPQGLNWWTIVSGMGMNFVLTAFLLLGLATLTAGEGGAGEVVVSLTLSLGAFLIPLLTAYVCGRISGERFLAYGFYPLVGFAVLAVPSALSSLMFSVLMLGFGALGAFNGANLVARRSVRRRREIYGTEPAGEADQPGNPDGAPEARA
jgi:hypothetical protein